MNEIEERFELKLSEAFDQTLDDLLLAFGGASAQTGGGVKEYQTVGPVAREKLKGILKHYAKDPHPFAACVRDNTKRFGPDVDKVCAVLKDIIRGTTKWRGKDNPMDKGTSGIAGLSELPPELEPDKDVLALIDQLSELDLWKLMDLAQVDEDPGQNMRDAFFKKHPDMKNKEPGQGNHVSLKKDSKGYYVHTHRARSKSYPHPTDIPRKDVEFIESTG